jgi:NAD(P)-dependent dehydrogenase (short-subunit alcohol dehydrogenase family)
MPLNRPIPTWANQRVWVVGASSGIGAELSRQLLAAGARVALSGRRVNLLQEVAGYHANACLLPMDVQDESAWQAALQSIQSQFGGIDLIIFCAAEYRPERCWEVIPSVALSTLRTNLGSVYAGLAAVLPDLIQRGAGGIALVASVAGYVGLPGASVYGPSKAAMINLAEILYGDLHPKGINVYLINPGFVDTGLTRKNSFAMPALQTAQQASGAILRGMAAGQFEIHFPRRFTQMLKLLQMLPYRLRFFILKRLLP